MSPTQRSLKLLRDQGWHAEVVEQFNSFTKQRKDLFGFADIIAIREGERVLVQTTSGTNLAARRTKILSLDTHRLCLSAGFRIVLHGWRKVKVKRGGKAMVWSPRVEEIEP